MLFRSIKELVKVANEYKIPLEFNAKYWKIGETNKEKLDLMLSIVDQLYVNSDAHLLVDF